MTDAGLTPTQQPPLSSQASLEIDTDPVSDLWEQLFTHQSIRDLFIRAVRRFADGRTVPECYDALEALDPDGRKVELLRQLADEPAQTLSRHVLRAMHDVDRSRISQLLVSEENSLTELGLVAEFGPADDRTIELLEAGRQLLEQLDAQHGRQQELSETVSDTGTSSQQCRVTPRTRGEGDDGGEDSNPYRTAYLDRPGHAAAAGCEEDGGITLVEAPFEDCTDGPDHTRYVSFDGDRREAVVAVRASGPCSMW